MAKITYSEVFISIEGEGPHAGVPTIYLRVARCNFTCGMFNNPNRIVDKKGYAPLDFNPKDYTNIQELSPMEIGCDTQYSVNPTFKHMWEIGDEHQLAEKLTNLLPTNSWQHQHSGQETILSLTGGEPTLVWKTLPALLNHRNLDTLKTVLFETNCAVNFNNKFITELNSWIEKQPNRKIIWSNSPKLSASGEPYDKAIVPDIAIKQRYTTNFEQYFKFVCDAKEEHFDEVATAMEDYYAAGVPRSVGVYIMPMSCTEEQQQQIMLAVADMCIEKGYIYCHRVHNTVYRNEIGR
jgi:7-carboxy-7-deazaguanine synthase